jgi:pyruvate ferredoxin oxidoreductase gamma subunit
LKLHDTFSGISDGAVVIVNTETSDELKANLKQVKVFTVPATSLALRIIGRPIVNTAMIGAFAKAVGLPSLSSIEKVLPRFLDSRKVGKNFELVKVALEQTKLRILN